MAACPECTTRVAAACRECLQETASALILAEDRERRRIAAGLHDQVGQSLATARLRLGVLNAALPQELVPRVEEIRALLKETVEATRSLTFQISNPLLREAGLEAALECQAPSLAGDHDLRLAFDWQASTDSLPQATQIVLFQVMSELMFNVAKHARASSLRLGTRRNGREFMATVEDDGIGIGMKGRHSRRFRPAGLGLSIVRERLDQIGGRLDIDKAGRNGTKIVVSVPIPEGRRETERG
jgi:signal transduction histidine kinase